MKSLCGILHSRVLEVGANAIRRFSDHGHMVLGGGFQFRLRAHRDLGPDGVLHVGVQALVWVQFRRIARQIEDFNTVGALGEPVFHRLRVMGAKIIEDQKDLFGGVLDQRFEKLDQSIRIEVAVDNHPARLAFVGDGRDHRQWRCLSSA